LAAAQSYQLLVGGLLLQLAPEGFLEVQRRLGGLVLTGCTTTFWRKRPKARFYFLPHQGVARYCRMPPEDTLPVADAVEVPRLQFGPLADYLGK
jgi:hypothetical protein